MPYLKKLRDCDGAMQVVYNALSVEDPEDDDIFKLNGRIFFNLEINEKNVKVKTFDDIRCELISLPNPPNEDELKKLPISANFAYVRSGDDLYFVDKRRDRCDKLELEHGVIEKFDEAFHPSKNAKSISENKLIKLIEMTGYTPKDIMREIEGEKAFREKIDKKKGTHVFITRPIDPNGVLQAKDFLNLATEVYDGLSVNADDPYKAAQEKKVVMENILHDALKRVILGLKMEGNHQWDDFINSIKLEDNSKQAKEALEKTLIDCIAYALYSIVKNNSDQLRLSMQKEHEGQHVDKQEKKKPRIKFSLPLAGKQKKAASSPNTPSQSSRLSPDSQSSRKTQSAPVTPTHSGLSQDSDTGQSSPISTQTSSQKSRDTMFSTTSGAASDNSPVKSPEIKSPRKTSHHKK
jgi:hypothetical protein